jgi:hypothetical protein
MSMNSVTADSEQKADPLDVLKAWESGDLTRSLASEREPDALDYQQRKRLWALLNSNNNPGTISFQLPR